MNWRRYIPFLGWKLRIIPQPFKPPKKRIPDWKITQEVLTYTENALDDFRRKAKMIGKWGSIPRVVCAVSFGGCGYVEGRTEGMKVNSRLVVTEADDDMGFSEVCFVIDRTPTLLVRSSGHGLSVFIIAGQDYFEELLSPSTLPFSTVEQFNKLPDPVKTPLSDFMQAFYKSKPDPTEPMEKILAYGESR